jgi:hypothetical protein
VEIYFSAVALVVLGLLLLGLVWTGRASEYIDPRLSPLLFLSGLGCIVLAQVTLSASRDRQSPVADRVKIQVEDIPTDADGKGWQLLWLVLPFIILFLFP